MRSLKFKNNRLFYLDQTQLPLKEVWRECRNLEDGFSTIKRLGVRGAPLIGVFAAYCICIHLKKLSSTRRVFSKQFKKTLEYLNSARPTAVNLSWALRRLQKAAKGKDVSAIKKAVLEEAKTIHRQDILLCKKMASYGVKLIKKRDQILTHCNTGFLATSGDGTALSVIYEAARKYKNKITVYADETRPLLQGSRLTAWELLKRRVPSFVICDNMAASLMAKGKIDKVFLGADRIAGNGDTANKIGTYNVAVIAKYHKVPFYVVAPFSSFDLSLDSGRQIPIEQRKPQEVRRVLNKVDIAPKKAQVHNPAFDLTPHQLISAIVSDQGIIYPPFRKNIKKILCRSQK